MAGALRYQTFPFVFYDSTAAANALGRYSCVSLATAAEVATANAAGVQGNVGEICVQTPVAAGLATRRILGVVDASVLNGNEVSVIVSGIAYCQVSAACAVDAMVQAALGETRTNLQTPFTNNSEMLIPFDPRLPVTYNLVLVDDTAKPASGTVFWPLGFALKAATAKYDIIPVQIFGGELR